MPHVTCRQSPPFSGEDACCKLKAKLHREKFERKRKSFQVSQNWLQINCAAVVVTLILHKFLLLMSGWGKKYFCIINYDLTISMVDGNISA